MHLAGLFVYPVKSCAGVPVQRWQLDRYGLEHDRRAMVVDEAGGFLTQRQFPALATIRPEFIDAGLHLSSPSGDVDVAWQESGPQRQVEVWDYSGPAVDSGDQAAQFYSDHLGVRCRLVQIPRDHHRSSDPGYPQAPVAFSDGFPLLLTTEASLAELNSRLPEPLPMNRFRPNLVVAGSAPFAEDHWTRVSVGSMVIDIVKPCARCTITTVDQATGRREGGEPLRTLGTFRRGVRGVLFGQNAIHQQVGELAVGDPVTAEHHFSEQ